jgi:hypothetical protein
MRTLRRWSDLASAQAERLPLLDQLQSGTRKGLLAGAILGALVFMLLGGILGGLNRESAGALVGALSGAIWGLATGALGGAYLGTAYLPQEGHVTVALDLQEAGRRFAPGEVVTGHVRVTALNTLKITAGKVYMACRGFYVSDKAGSDGAGPLEFARESRQYLLQEASVIPAGIIRRGTTRAYPFRFTLPNEALPTHQGYVCAVHWTLHAIVDLPDLPRVSAQREIVVESQPPALSISRREYQTTISAQVCQVTLALLRVVYAQGEQLSGRMQLTALESFEADEVRAVLVRVENTPFGDDHIVYVNGWNPASGLFRGERRPGGLGTTYVWLEGEANLSGPVAFRVAETTAYPFTLDIPAEWRPTLITKDGRVAWKVGIIIARPGHSDVRAFHEIMVHTGEAHIAEILEPSEVPSSDEPAGGPVARLF